MGKKIGIAIAAVLAVLFVLVAIQPGEFRVERTTEIAAPPSAVYPLLADFRKWTAWSPWEKVDPNLQRTYSGAASGLGAIYEWSGNDKAGAGRMEITSARENAEIKIKLDFTKPFKAENTTLFTLTGDKSTKVSWVMTGKNNFVGKAFSLVMNMDKLVGGDFERGLAEMKKAAEAPRP